MTIEAAPICAVVPGDVDERTRWAFDELLARLGLPYWFIEPGQAISRPSIALAVGCELPPAAAGVALGGKECLDATEVGKLLADGGLTDRTVADGLNPSRLVLPVDLADIYERWLGRREEYGPIETDEHGRALFDRQELPAAGLDQTPVAELLAEAVAEVLARAARVAGIMLPQRRLPWPDGSPFAAHLSHDVDALGGRYQIWKRYLGWSAMGLRDWLCRRGTAGAYWKKIRRWMTEPGDLEYCLPRFVEMEKQYGATSSFYFFCNRTASTRGQMQGRMYRLTDPLARQAVQLVVDAGSEVGVHGTYSTFIDPAALADQKKLLESLSGVAVEGIRQHFLHLAVPDTWRAQQAAGFSYDATLGWAMNVGFRCGTCRPFRIWDVSSQQPMEMFQLPLILMDRSLLARSETRTEWMAIVTPIIDRVRAAGGILSVIAHSDRLNEMAWPGEGRFYQDLLQLLSEQGAALRSGREIIEAEANFRQGLFVS